MLKKVLASLAISGLLIGCGDGAANKPAPKPGTGGAGGAAKPSTDAGKKDDGKKDDGKKDDGKKDGGAGAGAKPSDPAKK